MIATSSDGHRAITFGPREVDGRPQSASSRFSLKLSSFGRIFDSGYTKKTETEIENVTEVATECQTGIGTESATGTGTEIANEIENDSKFSPYERGGEGGEKPIIGRPRASTRVRPTRKG
ncbi:hypothetical protein EVAR_60510_1 [Eumeta japonica]|uniref:Uncharacterized protein n=1 Tax=Eumeta variegata TaxID=151549 RepID=A0A4C1ZKA8_EUMVA|nr:hypothetical protein EVAR_60510_1 [Eumeta japonica]